jgi:signal transduction histidine kinase
VTQIKYRSLFQRLLLGFAAVTLVIWFCALCWDIEEAKSSSKTYWEQEIKMTARRLLVVMQAMSEHPDDMALVARRMERLHYVSYKEKDLYAPLLQMQIWKGPKLVYSSAGLGIPVTTPNASAYDQPIKDAWVSWVEQDPGSRITVRVAQEAVGWWLLSFSSIGYYLLPLLYSLPFLLIPAWYIIKVGMRPLNSIVTEIEDRSASDLSPLAGSPYKELSPLVGSINRLMNRLTERQEREQEFLIEAAHELKTPLAIIQVNAHSLMQARDPQRMQEASAGLSQGVHRATHTVHQLLALTRSDADGGDDDLHALDLVDLVRDRLVLAAPIVVQREIDIEFQSPEDCMLPLHRESMASLIDNLVDNAVKYSPYKGQVVVRVEEVKDAIRLMVADEGPGIPVELRKKVFERFFRQADQDQAGSGLGLAIAERAATRNKASIRLDVGIAGKGLAVIVEFSRDRSESNLADTSEGISYVE